MGVEDLRVGGDLLADDHVDRARTSLALIDGIRDDPLQLRTELDRLDRPRVGDAVCPGMVASIEDDLVAAQLTIDLDQRRCRRAIRVTWSRVSAGFADASIRMTLRGRSCAAYPVLMPACVLPVTEQTITVSKKTPSACSLRFDFLGPARESQAAKWVI